ncbi:hypothetical protein MMC14_000658 [Varicellaria rhodocarpa]|nr:hypothetical protein [Varicellaria rhodocarpa]
MIFSIAINGIMGFGMLLALLFCLGDPETALSTPTGYPFIAIFLQAVDSVSGALTMSAIITTLATLGTISWVAGASRMTWSFARDRGLPGWRYLSKVDERTSIPVIAIAVTTVIACLLGLISIGSTVGFNDVVSLTISGLFTSYMIDNSLLFYCRLTGAVHAPSEVSEQRTNTIDSDHLTWGPWRIPESFGTINNIFGCAWMIVVLCFSYWPTVNHPEAAQMSYSSLMVGSVIIFAIVYYFAWARKFYTGPVNEVDDLRR